MLPSATATTKVLVSHAFPSVRYSLSDYGYHETDSTDFLAELEMSQRPSLWALIVAINEYPNPTTHPRVGAIVDSENVFQYLISDSPGMGVPQNHIVRLHDADATRAEIISQFQTHLIRNPEIKRGDAVLFYYSGHGSYVKAPEGWIVVQGAGDSSDNMVEVILPYDEGVKDGIPTYAIPDRTLAALIDSAAAQHGDNITVILDCCSSAHGTRADTHDQPALFEGEPLVSRAIDQEFLTPLPPDLDHDLVSRLSSKGHKIGRRGRFQALGTNHVLLAACKAREKAQGREGNGGFLTLLWLSFMKGDIRPRTYAKAITFIDRCLRNLRDSNGRPLEQHPQCEGTVRERIIFEETMIQAAHFDAVPKVMGTSGNTGFEFEVEAGEIHGVGEGTSFEIYGVGGRTDSKTHRPDNVLTATKLGTAIAIRVNGRSSTVRPQPQLQPSKVYDAFSAVIIQKPTLNYMVYVDSPASPGDLGEYSDRDTLSKALTNVYPESIHEVTDPDDAALEVRIEVDGTITLRRLDKLMHQLRNITPRIERDGLKPETLPGIFRGIARFNHFLPLTNQKHPLVDKVSLEMRRLLKQGETNGVFPVRILGEVVPVDDFTNEHTVTDSDDYAIILHNDSNVDLYVQIWYFDPDEYSITPLYRSANVTQATLPQGGKLQIGASTELPWPLTYYVPEGAQIATMFAKVFLTDGPVKLRSLQQNPLIGPDASGRNPGEGKLELETKGLWDTMLLPITVVKTSGAPE